MHTKHTTGGNETKCIQGGGGGKRKWWLPGSGWNGQKSFLREVEWGRGVWKGREGGQERGKGVEKNQKGHGKDMGEGARIVRAGPAAEELWGVAPTEPQ